MAGTKYPLSLVIRAVDGVTKPLESINAKLEKTGARMSAPFARLGNRLGALGRAAGLPAIADSLGRTRDAAGALGSKLAGLGATFAGLGVAAGASFYSLARGAEAAGSRLLNLSTISGLSVQAFAELQYAAQQNGVANDQFAGGMEKFNKLLSEARRNTGPLAALLSKVGPEYLRQLRAVKSNEEAFNLVAKAMGKIENPGRRAELAAAAFGKSGAGMINALKDGPAGVDALREEFRRLAGDQTEFANNSNAFGAALTRVEVSMLGLRNTAMGALMPALTRLTDVVAGFIAKNRDGIQQWAERAGKAIQAWIDGGGVDRLVSGLGKLADTATALIDRVGGLGNALGLVGAVMVGPTLVAAGKLGLELISLGKEVVLLGVRFGTMLVGALGRAALGLLAFNFGPLIAGLGSAATAVWGFTAALLANPITWVVVAVAALAGAAYLIYKNWGPIKGFFLDLWQSIRFYFGQGWAWLQETSAAAGGALVGGIMSVWEPIKGFFSGLWDGIVGIFRGAWETIRPIVDGVLGVAQFVPGLGGAAGIIGGARTMLGGVGSAPPLGAAQALPAPAAAGGASTVRVDFANLPRGARVTPVRPGAVDLNLGYSLAPGT